MRFFRLSLQKHLQKIKYTVTVVFGKEQVEKFYRKIPLNNEEIELYVKEYCFNTENEKLAFIKGLNEGTGWMEFCIL